MFRFGLFFSHDGGVSKRSSPGDDFGMGLCDAGSAENAVDVPDRLERVWSMFWSNWMTDCLSNLSRTAEMVLTMLSKEWGSALMMAMTASSS